jgi:hypothetical protein
VVGGCGFLELMSQVDVAPELLKRGQRAMYAHGAS